ncbi:hypothetical protein ASE04_12280 [Rhizobium sp. Root708]|nr:hypothetical protein ASE04_12280 [Rhizobium sp. Root708]
MERLRIDHVRHGQALLAMRLPRIRPYLSRPHLAEVCESYSLVSLQIDRLRRENAPHATIEEYEDLRQSIEKEMRVYMLQSGRRTA